MIKKTMKYALLTGSALVALSVAAQAQTVTVNGSDVVVSADPNFTPAITFTTDHVATINDNVNLTGTVTAGTNNFGTLTFLGTSTVSGAVGSGNAVKRINAGANGETVTFNSTVNSQQGIFVTGTGTVALSGGNLTGALTFSGDGVVNVGAGRTISGAVTAGTTNFGTLNFAGSSANGSTLGAVGNKLKQLTISTASGSTVSFTGNSYAANTTNVRGNTLAIGGGGTFDMGAAQTLQIDITGATTSGQITSAGAATVASGATIAINVATSAYITSGQTFTLINGTGGTGVNGTLTITDNSALYTFAKVGGATEDLVVTATRVANNTVSSSDNNLAVANVMQDASMTGSVNAQVVAAQAALASASTNAAVNNVWESLLPTADGGTRAAIFTNVATVQNMGEVRLASLRNGEESTGWSAGDSGEGMGAWFQLFGQKGTQDARGGIDGYNANSFGGVIGFDSKRVLEGTTMGLALSYGVSNVDSKNANRTSTDIDSYGITFYAAHNLGERSFINAQAGYAYNKIDGNRYDVGAPGTTATADYHNNQYSAKVVLGRDYAGYSGLTVTPTASVSYVSLDSSGYTETGAGGLNLTVDSERLSALDLGIGVKIAGEVDSGAGMVKPNVHVGYAYDVIGDNLQLTSRFAGIAGSPAFVTNGADPAQSKFNVGTGVVFATADNWDLELNYDYELKSDFSSHNGFIRAGTHF